MPEQKIPDELVRASRYYLRRDPPSEMTAPEVAEQILLERRRRGFPERLFSGNWEECTKVICGLRFSSQVDWARVMELLEETK